MAETYARRPSPEEGLLVMATDGLLESFTDQRTIKLSLSSNSFLSKRPSA